MIVMLYHPDTGGQVMDLDSDENPVIKEHTYEYYPRKHDMISDWHIARFSGTYNDIEWVAVPTKMVPKAALAYASLLG